MSPRAQASFQTSDDSGFSLVEMIVSLAVLALIMAMMPGSLRLAQRAWSDISQIEKANTRASARGFIEQRLAEAMPILVADNSGARHLAFSGEPLRLAFVAPSAAGPAGGGLYRLTLTVEKTPKATALLLDLAPVQATAAPSPSDERRVLLDGVDGLHFRYFGRPSEVSERQWLDVWPDADHLPELVEIAATPSQVNSAFPRFQPIVIPLRLRRPY